jgi:Uma2 family endonuclease
MKPILDIPRTAMEVFNMLPEGTRCEVIDNTLFMSPSPTPNHQKILLKIAIALSNWVENNALGEVLIAPCDVYLTDGADVVQPDIIFITKQNIAIIKKRGVYGSPDLVIELLSSNSGYDKEKKFELYQKNGIAQYIIIDPETKAVWHYLLKEGKYEQAISEAGKLSISTLNSSITF